MTRDRMTKDRMTRDRMTGDRMTQTGEGAQSCVAAVLEPSAMPKSESSVAEKVELERTKMKAPGRCPGLTLLI